MLTGRFWSRHTHATVVLAAAGGLTLHYALAGQLRRPTPDQPSGQ